MGVPSIFRPARPGDCSHLAILSDMATRRLMSSMWSAASQPGQSSFEVGRSAILKNDVHFTHYTNWHVIEADGQVVGAMNCWPLPVQVADDYLSSSSLVLRPLNELKLVAGGSFYIVAAAVFPEFRGQGFGSILLGEAEKLARYRGYDCLSLMAGSFNPDAVRLYERLGFIERERRPFVSFPGADPQGEWILMVKALV